MSSQEFGPAFPVSPPDFIDQDHRDNSRFAGLHQRQAFKAFIHRSKAAWKQGDGVGFLDEINFASKKIVEIDEFWIAINRFIGFLLEWQPDVQSEAICSPGAPLGGAHNTIAATG